MPEGKTAGAQPEAALMSVVGVSFSYPGDKKPTLGKTDLELRRGSVVGLFGQNACGKTTLARCLCDRLQPATGTVTRSAAATASTSAAAGSSGDSGGSGRSGAYAVAAVVFAVAGAAVGAIWPKMPPQQQRQILQTLAQLGKVVGLGRLPAAGVAAFLGLALLVLLTELVLLLSRCLGDGNDAAGGSGNGGSRTPVGVSFITSEDNPANQLPQDATLETTLTGLLPASKFPDAESKREEAIRLMETANFQRYNQTTGEAEGNPREYVKDGVLLRECSGGQKHLIYVLRELAAERPILLLDELLCGLDNERQARVLAMLRERKSRTAMLYITTDLHSLSVMCSDKTDQVLYMHEGIITERATGGNGGGDMMGLPTTAKARQYVSAFRSMLKDPAGMLGSNLLADMAKHARATSSKGKDSAKS